jgi:hypothetical protein
MTRRRPSFGMFGVFGRSGDLRALDEALRAADLHPSLVPDAVKLTVLNLLKDAKGEDPATKDYGETAALLGYCVLGREAFGAANGGLAAAAAERRIEAALEAGEGQRVARGSSRCKPSHILLSGAQELLTFC